MYAKQSKKMMIFDILEILQKYSDVNHRLSQRDIEKYLKEKYDMKVDRKSIKRNLMDLVDMGLDIQYSENVRMVKSKETGETEEQYMLTDFYIQRDISDCEIRLIIDVLLDSEYISNNQKKALIKKLEGLTSIYFRKRFLPRYSNKSVKVNNQIFYSLDVIDEAINKRKKIRFFLKRYDLIETGGIKDTYIEHYATAIDTMVVNGRYNLICIENAGKEIMYRMDYIYDIEVTDIPADLINNPYINYDYYNFVTVRFLADKEQLQEFIEEFGYRALRIECVSDTVIVNVNTTERKAIEFASNHLKNVTIMDPSYLREEAEENLHKGLKRYKAS